MYLLNKRSHLDTEIWKCSDSAANKNVITNYNVTTTIGFCWNFYFQFQTGIIKFDNRKLESMHASFLNKIRLPSSCDPKSRKNVLSLDRNDVNVP